ncbi:MAG TPA: hypothetical protein VFL63_02505 [Rhodanobacteraceae bacterium]|jgi:hypothetical protein|nr:hypothetical protein [Rhodanobacteraceae bacterium]
MPAYSDSEIRQFQGVLAGNDPAAKLAYLEQIPVSPPDSATGNLISAGRGFLRDQTTHHAPIEFTKVKLDAAGERICYLTLKRAGVAKEGALTFDCATADSTPVVARGNCAPIWWLPWESRHMVKIKIAAQGAALQDNAGVALPNPDLFFTAAVSGCSVFVRGGQASPSVYHGGINGKLVDSGRGKTLVRGVFNKNQFKRVGGSTPGFWRQVLSGMDYDLARGDTALLRPTAGANKFNRVNDPVAEINTTHYTSDKGTSTTRNSRAFESFLKKQAKSRGRMINVVAPWGAVFGLRNGANWSFYLQQNVLVVYTKLTGGAPISDCVVLAVTRFSPGQGEARPPKLEKGDFARIEYALR